MQVGCSNKHTIIILRGECSANHTKAKNKIKIDKNLWSDRSISSELSFLIRSKNCTTVIANIQEQWEKQRTISSFRLPASSNNFLHYGPSIAVYGCDGNKRLN